MTLAKNKCCDCGHKWQDWSGVNAEIRVCPKCSSLYWYWLDYDIPEPAPQPSRLRDMLEDVAVPFAALAMFAAIIGGVFLLGYLADLLLVPAIMFIVELFY